VAALNQYKEKYMCNLTIAEGKDIVTMIASIAATAIAFLGLRTWRKKLLGENKFELSINVLKSLRKLIDEIENFRSPLYLANELYSAYYEIEKEDLSKQENISEINKANKYAQNLRWNKVINSYVEYDSKILHLKVILDNYEFDNAGNETMISFMKTLTESVYKEERYNDLLKPGITQSDDERKKYIEILEKNSYVMCKYDDNNELSKSMERSFLEIKKQLKKYLK